MARHPFAGLRLSMHTAAWRTYACGSSIALMGQSQPCTAGGCSCWRAGPLPPCDCFSLLLGPRHPCSGLFNTLFRVAHEEGLAALWKGLVPGLHRQVLLGGVRIASCELPCLPALCPALLAPRLLLQLLPSGRSCTAIVLQLVRFAAQAWLGRAPGGGPAAFGGCQHLCRSSGAQLAGWPAAPLPVLLVIITPFPGQLMLCSYMLHLPMPFPPGTDDPIRDFYGRMFHEEAGHTSIPTKIAAALTAGTLGVLVGNPTDGATPRLPAAAPACCTNARAEGGGWMPGGACPR